MHVTEGKWPGRRSSSSGGGVTLRRSPAGRGFGVSGDRLRAAVRAPQLRGASTRVPPAPTRGIEDSTSWLGAWLQQSAVQRHSPRQQQKYSVAAGRALLFATIPVPANCREAVRSVRTAVDLGRATTANIYHPSKARDDRHIRDHGGPGLQSSAVRRARVGST